jgi:hypothetical protein
MKANSRIFPVLLAASLLLTACANFGPPPECSEGLGGVADTAAFDAHFASMQLVSAASGAPGAPAEHGEAFAADEPLAIQVDSLGAGSLRACVQAASEIPIDQTYELAAGGQTLQLGALGEPGMYVVRVIVDGVLVKNLPFTLE